MNGVEDRTGNSLNFDAIYPNYLYPLGTKMPVNWSNVLLPYECDYRPTTIDYKIGEIYFDPTRLYSIAVDFIDGK